MSFIKVRRIPRNQRNERQQISRFVYLNEAAWFEKAFPNISFQRNIHGTNEFKNVKGATFLTSKEVSLLPFSKINSNQSRKIGDSAAADCGSDHQRSADVCHAAANGARLPFGDEERIPGGLGGTG